jgi:protoheme IX farnesyltransferase
MKRFRWMSALTTAATFVLMILGSYVKAIGAGLACPTWPRCFDRPGPAAWIPDLSQRLVFWEWLHRTVAVVVGFMILGTAAWAWLRHRDDRAVVGWSTAAAALLPLQVVLGGLTVTSRLEPLLVVAHLGTATLIIVFLALATQRAGHVEPAASGGGLREEARGLVDWGRDWIELTKPGILSLLVLSGLVAMVVAEGGPGVPLGLVAATLGGGGMAAAGASALNNYLDRDIDERMYRTRERALPDGRVRPRGALVFGVALSALAFVILTVYVNLLTALLALGGIVFYVGVYTWWLKRSTSQNIVIGGAAGGFPALVGWAAVRGEVALPAALMGALVFLWTPPHFWALALVYREDYARADVPMLPVAKGVDATRRQLFLYSVVLVGASLLFVWPLNLLGTVYLAGASLLGLGFLALAWQVWRDFSPRVSYRLFWYSIAYLGLLYAVMGVDRLLA